MILDRLNWESINWRLNKIFENILIFKNFKKFFNRKNPTNNPWHDELARKWWSKFSNSPKMDQSWTILFVKKAMTTTLTHGMKGPQHPCVCHVAFHYSFHTKYSWFWVNYTISHLTMNHFLFWSLNSFHPMFWPICFWVSYTISHLSTVYFLSWSLNYTFFILKLVTQLIKIVFFSISVNCTNGRMVW